MKKLEDYVTLDENGKLVFDNEAYNADLDRERNSASETAKSNTEKKLRKQIESEVREQIENEAKLTAEQKIEQELKKLADERKAFNIERIKAKYKTDNLFDDDEIESFASLITDNFEESEKRADTMISARKKRNETYEKTLKEQFQSGLPRNDGNGGDGGGGESEIAKIAKSYGTTNSERVEL